MLMMFATHKLRYSHFMEDTSEGVPQFATAEYAPNKPGLTCAACKQPITGSYYQINGLPACAECTTKVQAKNPSDSHAAFVRALVFGIAGAVVGFALYVFVALATGLAIGFVSLAVGFIVGKAMHLGSGGVGGRRYQIVAALLTYIAVSMSAVPIAIHQMQQHRPQAQVSATNIQSQPHNLAKAIGVLALVGVASPILDLQNPTHGIIGLIILFVGMRFAWRFTAGRNLSISGPHIPASAGAI
jgi:uncharacterized protein (DUF983 family)